MASLNLYNYLNLIGFVINTVVTFGASKILDFPDQTELSLKYSTIITPDGFTFAIWGIIFLSEGIFAILQMLPAFRSSRIIQDGVCYWFFLACLAQSGWVFAFGYENLILALVLMGLLLISLYRIITLQSRLPRTGPGEFWGSRFPFEIHCGWLFLAFALNVNVVVVSRSDSEIVQAIFGALSLLAFIGIILHIEFRLQGGPNYTIPIVFAWASFGIVRALSHPSENLLEIFSDQTIQSFMIASGILCITLLCTVALLVYKSRKGQQSSSALTPSPTSPLLD